MSGNSAYQQLLKETNQGPEQRRELFNYIQNARGGRAVVSFFISWYSHIPLSQEDADMLEEVLINTDTSNGITLLLDAPGGDGLAAERIIQICRTYSNGNFETVVPSRAKSAATMICLGSNKILMSPTSELGPIDPQVPMDIGGNMQWVAAHYIVKAYESLLEGAKSNNGPIEPYLQQLANFNAVNVEQLRGASRLATDIAVRSLEQGMLAGHARSDIEERITQFTDPEVTFSHGRGIYSDVAKSCGLDIEEIESTSELWAKIWALYQRSQWVVKNTQARKLIETNEMTFTSS